MGPIVKTVDHFEESTVLTISVDYLALQIQHLLESSRPWRLTPSTELCHNDITIGLTEIVCIAQHLSCQLKLSLCCCLSVRCPSVHPGIHPSCPPSCSLSRHPSVLRLPIVHLLGGHKSKQGERDMRPISGLWTLQVNTPETFFELGHCYLLN
jgi:hypothetical protein